MDQNEFSKYMNNISDWSKTELEIRYIRVTPDFIRNVVEDIKDNYSITQSISFIKSIRPGVSLVNNLRFTADGKNINENYEKSTLATYFADHKKIALSSEIPSESKVDISNILDLQVRYKIRLSYKPPGFNWVYDVTLVHDFKNIENQSVYANIKKQLYNENMNKDHFLKLIDNKLINKHELEIEYIDKVNPVSEINFKEIDVKIPSLLEYNNYLIVIEQLSEILSRKYKSFKSFLPNAVTLTSTRYNEFYPPVGYYLTHKTDGYRGLIYIKNNIIILICSNYFKIYYCKNKICKRKEPENIEEEKQDSNYIMDCEIIDNNVYIFDILVYESANVVEENFDTRFGLLEKLDIMLKGIKSDLNIKVKYIRKITNDLQRSFKDVIDYDPGFAYDGYMIIDSKSNYMNTKSFKIKTHNTIDFYLFKCPKEYLNKFGLVAKPNLVLYILYSTFSKLDLQKNKIRPLELTLKYFKNKGNTVPIHFTPNDYPNAYMYYSQHDLGLYTIAELNPKFNDDGFVGWEFIKIREDKLLEPNYYGNYYELAEEMWFANQNPLDINKMHLPADSYFKFHKSSAYYGQTSFNSYVKERLILENRNNRAVCDLASGRGQDVGRYLKFGYNNIMLVEYDKNAIAEFIKRLPKLIQKNSGKSMIGKNNIRILNTNLHNNYEDVLGKMRKITSLKNYSLVVCNFAIHYLVDSDVHLLNTVSLISELVEPGGTFIYTTNNNKAIHEEFTRLESDTIELYENDVVKYMIKKRYNEKVLDENLFQNVDWKLVFNDNMLTEPLMPHNKFNEMLKSHGFNIYKEGPFTDYLKDFKKEGLSEQDKKYVGFYYYCILKRD